MLTTLHSFNGTDGSQPNGLAQATDGDFYGTTSDGGTNGGYGTVFKITPAGELTTLHSFGNTDGSGPNTLTQATDGNFYGTAFDGGDNDDGTVFRLDTGRFSPLSVTKAGNGTVTSGDGHIYCGDVCAYPYPKSTKVGLTAIPLPAIRSVLGLAATTRKVASAP